MDPVKQLPRSRQIFSVNSKGDTNKLSEEFFVWDTVEAINVPVKIRKKNTAFRTVGKEKIYAIQPTETDIHWFSLNSELPNELFEKAVLRNQIIC